MSETTFKNLDLSTSVNQGDFTFLKNQIDDDLEKIIVCFRDGDLDKLKKEVERQRRKTVHEIRKTENNTFFIFGTYIGFLNAFDEYLLVQDEKNQVFSMLSNSKAEDVPHADDIIRTIFKNEGIKHGKLAEKVGIDRSTLTPIMDRLVTHGMVSFIRPGKFKYYYLTPIGEKYYHEKLVNYEKDFDFDYLVEKILIAISQSENPTESIQKVSDAIFSTQHKFKGYHANTEKKVRPEPLLINLINASSSNLFVKVSKGYKPVNRADFFTTYEQNSFPKSHLLFDYDNATNIQKKEA